MKPYFIIFLFLFSGVRAQEKKTMSLTEAQELSQKNYPAIQQKELVKKTEQISIENLSKNFLPQITLNGQASYQSDVTAVPFDVPGFKIESPSKDQYKAVADISQLIYDGGATKQQKQLQQLNAAVGTQEVEVEMFKVRRRVNDLFLGVLYIDEQLSQVELVKKDVQSGIDKVEAQVNNGVAFRSNLNTLKAEWLKADQRRTELSSARKGLLNALSLFTGQQINSDVELIHPQPPSMTGSEISRPELKLFSTRIAAINKQHDLINVKNLPKASLFAQGGYGRPGLNMLNNDFDLYYVAGVKINWSLSGLYTKKKEKQLVEVNKKMVAVQEETFLLNTKTELTQQQSEIEKLEQLIRSDKEIIELRASVKDAARVQLENAVITSNDYLREVNAEDQARQMLITHELQLLQAKINYQNISGKL